MKITIRAVDEDNRIQVLALRVRAGQEGFIESTAECLEEADRDGRWRPVGLYDGDALIGFAMYGAFPDAAGRVWLDRFLIGADYQGRGYGTKALEQLIARLSGEYGCDKIFLSIYADNKAALRIYKRFGFRFNDEVDTKGELVMVREIHR